jgi:hypothetical protein
VLSLVTDVVVDKARPASEAVMDIGGSQLHPGEVGRRGFVTVSWVEIELWIGRNRLAIGWPRGHDMVEVFSIVTNPKRCEATSNACQRRVSIDRVKGLQPPRALFAQRRDLFG